MSSIADLLNSLRESGGGLTLTDVLSRHPRFAKRTVQRHIAKFIKTGQITALGEGRARRYFVVGREPRHDAPAKASESFPSSIPLSADARDLLAYIDQPLDTRKPERSAGTCARTAVARSPVPGSYCSTPGHHTTRLGRAWRRDPNLCPRTRTRPGRRPAKPPLQPHKRFSRGMVAPGTVFR